MDWTDDAIVLSVRPHGEARLIVELLTRGHGRHLGIVRGSTRKHGAVLQPGSSVRATWRARLEDHLGSWTIEPVKSRASIVLGDAAGLAGLNAVCALTSLTLAEREPHGALFEVFEVLMDSMDDPQVWPALYIKWELGLLAELGFGLELETCAVTGVNDDLTHVSPRTGKAVTRSEAEPWLDRLLRLPRFLRPNGGSDVAPEDIRDGLRLTGHFLEMRVWRAHNAAEPEARQRLVAALEKLA